jgi:large subunit ribosomal protein L28
MNKRFWLEDEKRWITLKVSARGMRLIDKLGLPTVVAQLRARGEKL